MDYDNPSLKDYVISIYEKPHCSIFHLDVGGNNFEIKSSIVGMVQENHFARLPTKKPKLSFFDLYQILRYAKNE